MRDGRATWADLAVELGLTAPAIAQRVRRLQDRGIIRHFGVWLDTDELVPVSAFVAVSVGAPAGHAVFQHAVTRLDAVQECHQVTGDHDYLLKVRCASINHLATLVTDTLPRMTGGGRVSSTVILSTVKDSASLPLPSLETVPEGSHV
ncbi:MAG TPA: Lrp/AsnC family transcriptional regulator [Chloroflexota bacterium]|nr:Lrp/AsnC family transcriptional regulator [Chloroflexota bacterium]